MTAVSQLDIVMRGLDAANSLGMELSKRQSDGTAGGYPQTVADAFWKTLWEHVLPTPTNMQSINVQAYETAFPKLKIAREQQRTSPKILMTDYIQELTDIRSALNSDINDGGYIVHVKTEVQRSLTLVGAYMGLSAPEVMTGGGTVNYAKMADDFSIQDLMAMSAQVDRLWQLVHIKEMADIHAREIRS